MFIAIEHGMLWTKYEGYLEINICGKGRLEAWSVGAGSAISVSDLGSFGNTELLHLRDHNHMPEIGNDISARGKPDQQRTSAVTHKWYDRPPATKEEREVVEAFLRWRFPERWDPAS